MGDGILAGRAETGNQFCHGVARIYLYPYTYGTIPPIEPILTMAPLSLIKSG